MSREQRPFSDTQNFVRLVHEEAFIEEVSVEKVDPTKPHSIINGQHYQAQFRQVEVRPGETIPLVMNDRTNNLNTPRPERLPSTIRRPNATLLYLFGNQSKREIAQQYETHVSSVTRDIKTHVGDLHKKSTLPSLRHQYDFESFNLGRDHGTGRRRLLKAHGTSETYRAKIAELRRKVEDPNTTDEERKELLMMFNSRGKIKTHQRGENPLLSSIKRVQKLAWNNNDLRSRQEAFDIVEAAIGAVIARPYKNTWYSALFTVDEDRAVAALKTARKELQGSRVQHRYGPEAGLPTTNQLRGTQRHTHRTVQSMIRELGLKTSTQSNKVKWALEASPVPIVNYGRYLYLNVAHEEAFKAHLLRFIGE